jgi:hypothetical protein
MTTRVTAAQIEEVLDAVMAGVERELRTPPEQRTAATYERLAALHRHEAQAWKAYMEMCRRRIGWTAACAAADRAHQLAVRYQRKAAALRGCGEGWSAEHVMGEVA